MDAESFDRLSVIVHRLRNKTTRRSALGLLLGGATAAAALGADDAEARRQRGNRTRGCRGYARSCGSDRDCCSRNCINNHCYPGSGGGGGRERCGGQNCQSDWRCCKSNGVSVCVPRNYPTCCGNQSFREGYTCCGGSGGACPGGADRCTGQFGVCCQSGWKYCSSGFYKGRCIPKDWSCNDLSHSSNADGISAESAESVPTADPVAIPDDAWIDLHK